MSVDPSLNHFCVSRTQPYHICPFGITPPVVPALATAAGEGPSGERAVCCCHPGALPALPCCHREAEGFLDVSILVFLFSVGVQQRGRIRHTGHGFHLDVQMELIEGEHGIAIGPESGKGKRLYLVHVLCQIYSDANKLLTSPCFFRSTGG